MATFPTSERWKRTQKTLQGNPKIDTLFTRNSSIRANKGNIDSHGSSYCNLEVLFCSSADVCVRVIIQH